ncbi:MAG TPA: hypothetical protein PLY17_05515 [Candidatus Hydrogenedentes bacterium]|nr:hypothetical protein [Candidatus Hydrogenedentota bacterium]
MSGSIRIYDTTLREGFAGVGAAVSVDQAVAIARALEKAGVSAIEAGYPAQSPAQRDIVTAVAGAVRASEVAALAACDPAETAAAVHAVGRAAKPLVHVYLPARAACDAGGRVEVCRAIQEAVAAVRAAGPEVQFSIAGMETMERPFRRQCIGVAVDAGATRIAVPDSTGAMETAAYAELVRDIVQFVGPRITVSAHCHNASGRAVQNALAAIDAGASQVETTVRGIGPSGGNTALEDIAGRIRGRAGTCTVDRRAVAAMASLMPETHIRECAEGVCAARDAALSGAPASRPEWYCLVEVAAL